MPDEADQRHLELTGQEERLVDFIRAGMVDAEIAVRLGISTTEVKERVERLMWQRGANGREALRVPPSTEEPPAGPDRQAARPSLARSAARWKLSTAALGALTVMLAAFIVAGWDDHSQLPSPSAAAATPSPPATPTPAPAALPTTIAGRLMFDAGQLFTGGSQPVVGSGGAVDALVETRESLLVIALSRASVFRYRDGRIQWTIRGAGPHFLSLIGHVGPREVLLALQAQGDTAFIFGDDDSVAVFAAGASRPTIAL